MLMSKPKIKIAAVNDTECIVTNLENGKEMSLKGKDAILMLSLHNNKNASIPEEFLNYAIRVGRPLPFLGDDLLAYLAAN